MIRKYPDLDDFHEAYMNRLSDIVRDFPIEDGDRIVELGSTSGFLTFPLAEQFSQCNIIAIDTDQEDLNKLKETSEERDLDNIEVYRAEANELNELNDNSVDAVISNFFLSEIVSRSKLKDIFREVSRILKMSGHTIHSELFRKQHTREQHLLVIADRYYSERDVRWWEPEMVEHFLKQTGFDHVVRENFKWKLGLKGDAITNLLNNWDIYPGFKEKYQADLDENGLAFPQGYILTAKLARN